MNEGASSQGPSSALSRSGSNFRRARPRFSAPGEGPPSADERHRSLAGIRGRAGRPPSEGSPSTEGDLSHCRDGRSESRTRRRGSFYGSGMAPKGLALLSALLHRADLRHAGVPSVRCREDPGYSIGEPLRGEGVRFRPHSPPRGILGAVEGVPRHGLRAHRMCRRAKPGSRQVEAGTAEAGFPSRYRTPRTLKASLGRSGDAGRGRADSREGSTGPNR